MVYGKAQSKACQKAEYNAKTTDLCEAPSFPEPEVAFPLSPPLPLTKPVFPAVPLGFLAEARSFPSVPFPSNSGFVGGTAAEV